MNAYYVYLLIHTSSGNQQHTCAKDKNRANHVEDRCADAAGFRKLCACFIDNACFRKCRNRSFCRGFLSHIHIICASIEISFRYVVNRNIITAILYKIRGFRIVFCCLFVVLCCCT